MKALHVRSTDWREREQSELGMTNFDHSIDEGLEEQLREGKHWASYTAWDFYGHVWFADGMFHSDVWQYCKSVDVLSAPTLRELMDLSCDHYGAA